MTLTDISEGMLQVAKHRLKHSGTVCIVQNDIHKISFPPCSFTKIVSVSALHYHEHAQQVIAKFHQLLKPGGTLVIIDWSRNSWHFKIFDVFMRMFTRSHVKIYTLEELSEMLRKEGFVIEKSARWSCGLWSLMGVRVRRNIQRVVLSQKR